MHNGADIEGVRDQAQGAWPRQIDVSVWLVSEGDRWNALASDYNVIGVGPSQEAAIANLKENIKAYFASFAKEGRSLKDARRPVPLKERLRLRFFALVTRVGKALTSNKRRQSIDFDGPRTVEHLHEALGPFAIHC